MPGFRPDYAQVSGTGWKRKVPQKKYRPVPVGQGKGEKAR